MKAETKVGLLFIGSLVVLAGFAYTLGILNPFANANELNVLYNFAGGLEEGSPVRVMGIKVGKVKKILFAPDQKSESGEEVKLKVIINLDKKAWSSIRKDSKFFINLAGVIGEKFLEITPGSMAEPEFHVGDTIRGEDPPRIDQLISQSYGLAGKILDLVEKNKGNVTNVIDQLDKLVTNVNKTLALLDKTTKNKEVAHLVDNVIKISDDVVYLTDAMRSKKAEETYALVHKLLFRLEDLDGPQIRKFLQVEGVKAKIF
jgi:phospholipid/cholesterol/gamma-HCH transport system substrate-binding protein